LALKFNIYKYVRKNEKLKDFQVDLIARGVQIVTASLIIDILISFNFKKFLMGIIIVSILYFMGEKIITGRWSQ